MLEHHWRREKLIPLDQLAIVAEQLRNANKKLVTVNGAFDILHAGHLDLLEEAKQQGDILFIGVNSDESIRAKKGADRPFIDQDNRAALLAALICVDYVTVIDAPYADVQNVLLRAVRPAVHVNGSDYGSPEQWIEWPVMQEVGATGYAVTRRPGLATSDIVKKIRGTSA